MENRTLLPSLAVPACPTMCDPMVVCFYLGYPALYVCGVLRGVYVCWRELGVLCV